MKTERTSEQVAANMSIEEINAPRVGEPDLNIILNDIWREPADLRVDIIVSEIANLDNDQIRDVIELCQEILEFRTS